MHSKQRLSGTKTCMKQSGQSFIPHFALIKLLLRLAAFTCLSLLSPWRSLHPLSPRQHKLGDLEPAVVWREEGRDSEIGRKGQTISPSEYEMKRKSNMKKRWIKTAEGRGRECKKNKHSNQEKSSGCHNSENGRKIVQTGCCFVL